MDTEDRRNFGTADSLVLCPEFSGSGTEKTSDNEMAEECWLPIISIIIEISSDSGKSEGLACAQISPVKSISLRCTTSYDEYLYLGRIRYIQSYGSITCASCE